MNLIDRVILEWSYKTKKGYPDINSQEDMALFESIFGFIPLLNEDKDKRFELANTLLANQDIEKGFEHLLILFEQDPKWKEEAPKKKLLEFFEVLGFNDPNVIVARKKLSSIMFK